MKVAKLTMQQFEKIIEQEQKKKHMALYKKYGQSAIATIKQELPKGATLREYLTELQKEIVVQN